MSKLALMRQYQYSPQAGGIFGSIIGGIGKFIGKGLGIIKPAAAAAAPVLAKVAKNPAAQAAAAGAAMVGAQALLGRGGGGASGGWGSPRRARGITARELRGYRKVANLLHKEGMVSKRARRGK